jgi:hypothetical protein
MKCNYLFVVCFLAAVCVTGCESYRETVRSAGHGLGAIEPRDIQQADAYRKALPGHLGLAPEQINVTAGSGITEVRISGVTADSDRQRITSAISSLNSQNPQLNPLHLTFQ